MAPVPSAPALPLFRHVFAVIFLCSFLFSFGGSIFFKFESHVNDLDVIIDSWRSIVSRVTAT